MARAVLASRQLGFDFEPPRLPTREAALAGLDRLVAGAVAVALKADDRSRAEVAGAMTALLGDEVTKLMLDAYASEARDNHNISAGRFFALIAVTRRFDVLDQVCERVGCRVLIGEEVHTAELGHIDRRIAELQVRRKEVAQLARPLHRGAAA